MNDVYICKSINNNKALTVWTTRGNLICQISVEHDSAYIQGEEVLIKNKKGRILIYSIKGNYKNMI